MLILMVALLTMVESYIGAIVLHLTGMLVLLYYYFLRVERVDFLFVIAFGSILTGNLLHYINGASAFIWEMGFIFTANLVLLIYAIKDVRQTRFKAVNNWVIPAAAIALGVFIYEMLMVSKEGLDSLFWYGVVYSIGLGLLVYLALLTFINRSSRRQLWLVYTAVGCIVSDFLLSMELFTGHLMVFVIGNVVFQMLAEFAFVIYALMKPRQYVDALEE